MGAETVSVCRAEPDRLPPVLTPTSGTQSPHPPALGVWDLGSGEAVVSATVSLSTVCHDLKLSSSTKLFSGRQGLGRKTYGPFR